MAVKQAKPGQPTRVKPAAPEPAEIPIPATPAQIADAAADDAEHQRRLAEPHRFGMFKVRDRAVIGGFNKAFQE